MRRVFLGSDCSHFVRQHSVGAGLALMRRLHSCTRLLDVRLSCQSQVAGRRTERDECKDRLIPLYYCPNIRNSSWTGL